MFFSCSDNIFQIIWSSIEESDYTSHEGYPMHRINEILVLIFFYQERRGNISFVPASTINPWPNKVAYVYLAVSVPSYETGWLWIICDAIWAKHTSVAMRLLNGIYDHTIQVMLRFYYTVENIVLIQDNK